MSNNKFDEFVRNPWFSLFTAILTILIIVMCFTRANNRNGVVKNVNKTNKLMLIMDQVEQNYVDTIDYKDIVEKTVPVLLQSLDPHSLYLPPQELTKADESLQGNFSGIGIEFNVPNDTAVVVSVIPGGPSAKVGLQSGDRIIGVDGKNVAGVKMNQDSLVSLMRGARGSKVEVWIKRPQLSEQLQFTIKRDIIPVKSVDVATMITDKLAYVKISKFSKTTYSEFMKSVLPLLDKGMTSMFLDLRDNPGGYMDQAFLLANQFLDRKSLIVYMEGRKRPREDFMADGKGLCKDVKLYVAINENSASSSEIVAGAIQDNDRGTIVGRRSFGKGVVQEPIYFSDGSGIRLTVARFYTPSGRCIQKPYTPDYMYDIYERYQHGELQNADSIKTNDSLAYKTIGGRTVYGGGGIVPDVFVPLDTIGVSDFWRGINRKSVILKFTSEFADKHRERLSEIKTLKDLDAMYAKTDLKGLFLDFASQNGVKAAPGDWERLGDVIISQLKGLIGRYTQLDDDAFYPYILKIDNVADKILEMDSAE
ncbi:MAG: S41 family peptidase [Candidatus Egerieousia sp.]